MTHRHALFLLDDEKERPYSLFSTLVDTIKAVKTDSGGNSPNSQLSPKQSFTVVDKQTAGHRLSGIISKIRSREGSINNNDSPQQIKQVQSSQRLQKDSPYYSRSITLCSPNSPTGHYYRRRRRSRSLEASPSRSNYIQQTSRGYNSPTQLSNFTKLRGEGYSCPQVPPHRSIHNDDDDDVDNNDDGNDNGSLSLIDGYLPNRSRRLSPTRTTLMNNRIYSGTPSPQMVTDDDDEPMPSVVCQRRLPLIGTLPLTTSLRSSDHYTTPYHTARSDLDVSGGSGATYYTPTDDIPSPSPSSAHNFSTYGQRSNFRSRLPVGYNDWRTSSVTVGYHGNNITPYSRVSRSGNSAPTIIYAGNRLRPMIRVIRAQPGNMPLSDSDNDEPKWAVV
ncbi:unnamed protein product [Cercopithifilaria johnstoni]|uniref:Uncharacterized protein n=2 Tax=Cercopithifilaria johnstoni TaxID=2874296 RepID=A0A8J2QB70_9BILA|nr:unnamed protein product [Cercopithifilaria johnstoni]